MHALCQHPQVIVKYKLRKLVQGQGVATLHVLCGAVVLPYEMPLDLKSLGIFCEYSCQSWIYIRPGTDSSNARRCCT